MKCLMFIWELSGLDRFDARLKALEKVGVKFTIIYAHDDLTDPMRSNYYSYLKLSHVKFKPYPSYLKWLCSRKHILKQIEGIDFDIVFSLSGIWFQYYSGFVAEKLGKPYVLFLRGNGLEAPKLQERNRLSIAIRNYIYKNNGWNCDLVIPISYELRDLATKMGIDEGKIGKVISGGIDTDVFRTRKIRKNPWRYNFTVGYAGRINKEKGSDFLLKLIEDNPEIRFNIAGPIQTPFIMPDNVEYKGVIPHDAMPRFYNECDLIIMVSKIEGYPRVILEAYGCGVPIFCTPESLPYGCEIYGFVEERDLGKWKTVFTAAMIDRQWLTGQGLAARKYAMQFDLETYAREMRAQLEIFISDTELRAVKS